jgi:hypothetical protein
MGCDTTSSKLGRRDVPPSLASLTSQRALSLSHQAPEAAVVAAPDAARPAHRGPKSSPQTPCRRQAAADRDVASADIVAEANHHHAPVATAAGHSAKALPSWGHHPSLRDLPRELWQETLPAFGDRAAATMARLAAAAARGGGRGWTCSAVLGFAPEVPGSSDAGGLGFPGFHARCTFVYVLDIFKS